MNPFTADILEFKNREPNRIIVLYCCDTSVATAISAANQFYEKGFDNVFILSGGEIKAYPMRHKI